MNNWKIYAAVATPDGDDIDNYFNNINKSEFKPCADCQYWILTKPTNLGKLKHIAHQENTIYLHMEL